MQGNHPFAGRFTGQGEPGSLARRIVAGYWPYARTLRGPFEPNPHEDGESWEDAFFPLGRTFRDLMTGWVEGEDIMRMFESATKSK